MADVPGPVAEGSPRAHRAQMELPTAVVSRYYDKTVIEAEVAAGRHRQSVGGLWEQVGELQANFLVSRGLKPHHRLIDIGCGSLRGGIGLIRYLDAGNYVGTDLNESLLKAGYEIELAQAGLAYKLPRSNLVVDPEFDLSWCPMQFDFALAQSVFTSLPLNFLRVCLERLATFVVPGGRFLASIFIIPDDHPTSKPYRHPSGWTSYGAKEPYHYRFSDVEFCCRALPWKAVNLGDWAHPLSLQMIEFEKTR